MKSTRRLEIWSGGQSGVDRAALDAALEAGLPAGGWCPKGRLAEDGRIADRYPLLETPTADPAERTRRNVADTDATLVVTTGAPSGGTDFTLSEARRMDKPCLVAAPTDGASADAVRAWIEAHALRRLNVAGPRESEAPGIYAQAQAFLLCAFSSGGPVRAARDAGDGG